MFNNISYNVVVERFKVFAEGHFLIKRFTHGQIDQTDLEKDQQFPWMHLAPVEVRAAAGARVFTFDVIFADIPRDKEDKTDYQKEAISDCIRLAEDLISEIQNGLTVFGDLVEVDGESSITPFIEEWTHTLSGCTLAISISVPNNYDACDIPADWSFGGNSSSNPPTPITQLVLRVNNVDNVIQNVLDLIDGDNVTIEDLGDGRVRVNSTGGGGGTLVSTAYNANHTTATGNQYAVGDRVWYNGNVYACIAANDAILPTNTAYWTLLGAGFRLRQSPIDYNATTGDFQILNKPTIPAAQVNSDWSAASGVAQILNKPTIPTLTSQLTNDSGFIVIGDVPPQVNSDWTAVGGVDEILNKPTLATVATSGQYTDLLTLPTIPTELDDLTDVYINAGTLVTGQSLIYDAGSGYFKNDDLPGGGTVTSVALTVPAAFSVSGSPVTTSGTLAITGAGIAAQYIDGTGALQTFPTLPPTIGDMLKSVYDTDADGVVDSAERVQIVVRNSTGVTLTKGQVVYLSGATGNRPNAVLADASLEATSSKTIGLVVANIANNADGEIAVNGTLHDLNTSAFAAGDTLYLSETAGAIQANTPPAEPAHSVFIGYVARAHPTLGRIVLAIQNGYELNELHGVLITSPAANDYLYYNGTSSLWENRQLTASVVTDSTTVGRALLTLPNPSAVRYLRVNAGNDVTALTIEQLRTDIGIPNGGYAVLSSDFTTVGVAFQNVTGLSFPVTAGKTYKWRATILMIATATTNGTLSTNGPAGTTTYRFTGGLGVSTNNVNNGISNNQTNSQAISLSLRIATADGIYIASASGTVSISVVSTVAAAITLKAGSIIEYDEII